jgi:transposase InsO family protein
LFPFSHSDQRRNFQSDTLKGICTGLGIDKARTTSFRPQSNDGVERFNRTLTSMLTMYCEKNQETWENYLQQVMMAYRSSVHASTSRTPHSMLLGREITLPLQSLIPQPREFNEVSSSEDKFTVCCLPPPPKS